jgi:tetratricopeptide (TPR) repeat protein
MPLPSKRTRFIAAGLVAAASLLAGPARAQDWKGQGRLEGKVLASDGTPVAGATVKLDNPARGGGPTIKTDKKGKWAFLGLVAGSWNIDVDAAGYATKKATITLASESARMSPFEIRLEALAHLQKVLDADPANTQIRAIMAQAALEGGMTDRGVELLAGIDAASVKEPDVFFNIGVNLLNAGRSEDAIAYFSRAIALDASYADGYFRRGLAHLQLGRTAEAKTDLKKVLELTPTGAQADLARKAIEQLN